MCNYQTLTFSCSNFQFSAKDVDNDLYDPDNCAVSKSAAWWYHSCSWANLNGLNLRKAYILQEFAVTQSKSTELCSRRPLCHKVNLQSCLARRPLSHKVFLPKCEARRRRFIMTCDIFGIGQTNILSLCYLLGKTYKQPTVAHFKSLKSTYSTKQLHLLRRTIRYH